MSHNHTEELVLCEQRKHILRSDFNILSTTSGSLSSAASAALIASHTSRRRLWDVALNKGVMGTCTLQTLFKGLCCPSSCFKCSLCDPDMPSNMSCLQHACETHPEITRALYPCATASYDDLYRLCTHKFGDFRQIFCVLVGTCGG